MPLLATKLFIPPPGKNLVERPRLVNKLDECLQLGCRLTLISAPAGFGKSTLVSTWIHNLQGAEAELSPQFAWLTVDEGDNDLGSFWLYVISSLQLLHDKIGQQTKSLLQVPNLPDMELALAILINDLSQVSHPMILILDDFHCIHNQAIHKSLAYLINHAPSQFHLLVVSRTDPPLPLALLRGRQQLLEIRTADLRFTLDETAIFVKHNTQVVLGDEEIDVLNQRTEGWIAGLQMAAISMKKQADQQSFIAAFSGNDRYISDFLIEEVLEGQPKEIQRFLLQTSILDHLNAPLCEAVTGYQKSQEMLNALEKANLFISPLDNNSEWFRYHQLFAELLHHKLISTYGQTAVKDLEHRAIDWLAENGYPQMAMEYALKYADYELVASLMTFYGPQFIKDSAFLTILRLAENIPKALITHNIILTCILTHSAMATGHMQMANQLIQDMEKELGVTIDEFIQKGDELELPPLTKAGLIELGVFNARTCVDTFQIDRTFYLSQQLLPYLISDCEYHTFALNSPSGLRASLLFTLGLAHMMHGDVSEAAKIFVESANEGRRCHNLDLEILSLGHLGDALVLEGRLHEAQKTYQQTLLVPQKILNKTPFFKISKAGLGSLHYEWNELDQANEYFQAAIEQGLWWRNWENLLPGYIGMARIHASRGNWEAAYTALDDLLINVQEKEGIVKTSAEAIRALLDFRRGDFDSAERWADDYEPGHSFDYRVEWEKDALVACRVWIQLCQVDRADILLEQIISGASAAGRSKITLEALCIRAILYDSIEKRSEAISALASCLTMAKSENYIRTFVDEGQPMASLLTEAARLGIQTEYASKLLEAFPPFGLKTAIGGVSPRMPTSPYERLTTREIEVLRFIAEGYTNKEIAQKLCLSLRTVKYHATSIYTKLNVAGRAHAVAKGRELGLL
jgi:ATP/maltotriose-dependent transcriptional regulator MalT